MGRNNITWSFFVYDIKIGLGMLHLSVVESMYIVAYVQVLKACAHYIPPMHKCMILVLVKSQRKLCPFLVKEFWTFSIYFIFYRD